jgi:hypothetical protein
MKSDSNGGPAFPNGHDVTLGQFEPSPGMTLRDYFAGQAMAADFCSAGLDGVKTGEFVKLAKAYYRMADAMLLYRKSTQGK